MGEAAPDQGRLTKAAGIAVAFVGYTLVWWGWYRLGGPVDLLDLIVPGRAQGTPHRGPA